MAGTSAPGMLDWAGTVAAIATDDAIGGFVVSGMLVAIGALMMKGAFERRRQRQLIEETPTEDIESLTLGPSEVQGEVVPAEESLRAPFSDDDCVIAQWEVEQYFYDSEDNTSEWRTVASGIECVPFYVDDGTGRLLVEPDEDVVYEMEEGTEPTFEVDARQEPPEAVREFFRDRGFSPKESLVSTLGLAQDFDFRHGGGFTFDMGNRNRGDRRYHQNLICPGEEVFVFGTVQPRESARSSRNPDNLVIKRVPEEDRDLEPLFMISDHEEVQLAEGRRHALLMFPVGALLVTAGIGGLLFVASLVLGIDLQL